MHEHAGLTAGGGHWRCYLLLAFCFAFLSLQRWLLRVTSGIQEIQSFWHLRLLGESLNYEAFSAKTMPSGPFKNWFFFRFACFALNRAALTAEVEGGAFFCCWGWTLQVLPSFSFLPCVFERAALTAWRWYLICQLLCIFERAALAAEGGSFNRFNFLGQAISREKFVIDSAGTILCLRSSIAEVPDQSLCNIKCLTECLYTTTPKCWTIPLPIAQVSQVYACKW